MFSSRRQTAATILAACAVAGFTAGCGGGTDDPASATAVDTTSAPADLRWENLYGVRVPTSKTAGPTSGETQMGYSQTPQGAVVAAIRGQVTLAMASDNSWGKAVSYITAPGPGRDEFVANRAVVSVTAGEVPTGQAPTFVGFKVTDYQSGDPTTAGVQIAQQIGNPPELFAYPVALQWIEGDWRIVLPTAAEDIDATLLDNLDGFTLLEDK
ncbi:hypothetical protein [Rhodococcus sp. ACT016]|uniref:hypothetical protein n=1 Tax=Rhodococcus sp. ACT016 TaxID=3134808 RepID=UPI003D26E481